MTYHDRVAAIGWLENWLDQKSSYVIWRGNSKLISLRREIRRGSEYALRNHDRCDRCGEGVQFDGRGRQHEAPSPNAAMEEAVAQR